MRDARNKRRKRLRKIEEFSLLKSFNSLAMPRSCFLSILKATSFNLFSFPNNWHSRNTLSIHSSCLARCCCSYLTAWRNAKMDFDNFLFMRRLSFLFPLIYAPSQTVMPPYIPQMSLVNSLISIKIGLSAVKFMVATLGSIAHSRPSFYLFFINFLLSYFLRCFGDQKRAEWRGEINDV